MDAFGIDIGGSGIKGAPVDLEKGCFAAERLRIPTPEVSTPDAVARVCRELLDSFNVDPSVPVGVAFPAPIHPGRPIGYMSNLDKSWIGVDITAKLSGACGRAVRVVNDADAAGLAEARYGAARGSKGLVVAVTLGTGIGTALVMDGKLIPNSELGHITMGEALGQAPHQVPAPPRVLPQPRGLRHRRRREQEAREVLPLPRGGDPGLPGRPPQRRRHRRRRLLRGGRVRRPSPSQPQATWREERRARRSSRPLSEGARRG